MRRRSESKEEEGGASKQRKTDLSTEEQRGESRVCSRACVSLCLTILAFCSEAARIGSQVVPAFCKQLRGGCKHATQYLQYNAEAGAVVQQAHRCCV
jgi:hypothetical protein